MPGASQSGRTGTDPLVADTIAHWQRAAGVSLTDADACEAIRGVTDFVELLGRWDQTEAQEREAKLEKRSADEITPVAETEVT